MKKGSIWIFEGLFPGGLILCDFVDYVFDGYSDKFQML